MKKWYAVIGDPINQSMSPTMHEQWFAENNLLASYIPIKATSENLKEVVMGLKNLGCSGWNVTVPHKSAIIPLLDELEPSAKSMNAVNTVEVLKDGSLRGSNTDGQGFVESLEEMFGTQCKDNGKSVLIIGAGGAARGISYALVEAGYGPIVFTNRTKVNADELSSEIANSSVLSIKDAEEKLSMFGLIIQTTSVGMKYAKEGLPLNPEKLSGNTVVADIIYNPLESMFLTEALKKGALVMNGTGMFIHQGALSFNKWTNLKPNTETMIEKITEILGGTYVNE